MTFTITTVYADGREETREATPQEVAQREADEAAYAADVARRKAAEEARLSALQSAKDKLAELGLTGDEIAALRNELIEF